MSEGRAALTRRYVQTLGPTALVAADGSITEFSGTQRRILARLALSAPHPVALSELVDAVWESDPPASAKQAIQNQISRIRRAVGEESIVTIADRYKLTVPTDVTLLREAVVSGERLLSQDPADALTAHDQIDSALQIWGEGVLNDLDHLEVAAELSSLALLQELAENLRVEAALQLGRRSWSLLEAERLAEAAPLDERRAVSYVRALVINGRRGDALAVIRETDRRLRVELGLGVGEELSALEAQIISTTSLVATGHNQRSNDASVPFVMRDREVDRALDALADDQFVVIEGEPGSGVTRLLQEMAVRLRELRHRVVMVRADEHPYSAVSLIEAILDDLGLTNSTPAGALSAFRDLLAGSSMGQHLVLLIDDAHHAGPSSLQAVAEAVGSPVKVVVGVHMRVPDLAALQPVTIGLDPLDQAGVRMLARHRGLTDGPSIEWVFAQSGGNPLAADLLIDDCLSAARPKEEEGGAHLSSDVQHLVERLAANLNLHQRSALEIAAVAGDGYPIVALKTLSMPDDTLPGDLVCWTDDGVQRFRHGVVRAVVLDGIPRGRRAELHYSLGLAAQETGGPPATAARHLLAAAELNPAGAFAAARSAAHDATRFGAHADAAAWLARALEIEGGASEAEMLRLEIEWADATRLSGAPGHVDSLVRITESALESGDEELVTEAGFALLQLGGTSGVGDRDPKIGLLARRVIDFVNDPDRAAVLRGAASLAWSLTNEASRCRELFDEAEVLASSAPARRRVLPFAYLALGRPGDLPRRLKLTEELLHLASTDDDPIAQFEGFHLAFSNHLQTGDGVGARHCLAELSRLVERVGDVGRRWAVLYCTATIAHINGDDDQCEQLNREALNLFGPVAGDRALSVFSAQLLTLRLGQGQVIELRPLISELVKDQPDITAWHAAYAASVALPQPASPGGAPLALVDRPADLALTRRHAELALNDPQDDFTWLANHLVGGVAAASSCDSSLILTYRERLEPWADLGCWQGSCSFGSVAVVLGALCAAGGDPGAAQDYGRRALAFDASLGTPLAITRARAVNMFGPQVAATLLG